MLIDDTTLSAFLDNELSDEDAEFVRKELEHDEVLAARLAALTMVDLRVREYIDEQCQQPLPSSVNALLDTADASSTNVIPMKLWQRAGRQLQQHVALAASITLVVGFTLGQWLNAPNSDGLQQQIAAILESQPSGNDYEIADGYTLTPQLTFKDTAGDFCRHYQLTIEKALQTTSAIQCRRNGDWQTVAEFSVRSSGQQQLYQTASGARALDTVLDEMMATPALTQVEEAKSLSNSWQDQNEEIKL